MSLDRRKIRKNIAVTLITAAVFFAVTMPFRLLMHVVAVTEVRPAAALNPTCGLLYGVWGALGCAIGNLIADLISGYSPLMCALGFIVQMVYGLLPRVIWNRFKCEVRFNFAKNILRYMMITYLNTVVTALLLGFTMQVTGVSAIFSTTVLLMFLNNFVFCIILGIPIILAYNHIKLKKAKQKFSLNERFIIFFLVLAILSAAILGGFAIGLMYARADDLLTFWNRLFISISVDLFMFSLLIVGFVYYAEKHITLPMEKLAKAAVDYSSAENDELNTNLIVDTCKKYENVHGEAGVLAKAFGEMAVNIEKYVENITEMTAENERICAELNVAKLIQADMLPNIFPAFPRRK